MTFKYCDIAPNHNLTIRSDIKIAQMANKLLMCSKYSPFLPSLYHPALRPAVLLLLNREVLPGSRSNPSYSFFSRPLHVGQEQFVI